MLNNYGAGKHITSLFFSLVNWDKNLYIFKCGVRRKRTGTSYSNLVSHVRSSHLEYVGLMHPDKNVTQQRTQEFFSTSKAGKLFGRFDLIANGLLPFSCADNQLFYRRIKHDQTSRKTFMRYLPRLVQLVESKIESLLLNQFIFVFDGWSSNSTHFLAVYACLPAQKIIGFDSTLLTLSPLNDELRLNADEQIEFMSLILDEYDKSWDNVIC